MPIAVAYRPRSRGCGDGYFALSGVADSPGGDGMILGCLLLAEPLQALTMSFWLRYVLERHWDATSRLR